MIIPAYNAARTLAATIESALLQDVDDMEILVIDDGSTDSTADIAAAYAPRVSCTTTPNRGVSQARNTGIAASTGSYVAFLDADDVWRPGKLRRQLDLLEARPEVGLTFTALTIVDDDLRPIGVAPAHHRDDYTAALLHQCEVAISSVVVRRDALDRAGGFHPWFSQCADWELWLRMSLITDFAPVDEELVLYRSGAANMSRNVALLEEDSRAVFDSFFSHRRAAPWRHLRRATYGHNWVVLAGSYLHAREPRHAFRSLVRAALVHPPSLSYAAALPARRLRRRR